MKVCASPIISWSERPSRYADSRRVGEASGADDGECVLKAIGTLAALKLPGDAVVDAEDER